MTLSELEKEILELADYVEQFSQMHEGHHRYRRLPGQHSFQGSPTNVNATINSAMRTVFAEHEKQMRKEVVELLKSNLSNLRHEFRDRMKVISGE